MVSRRNETQPLPNPLSSWFHWLPRPLHRAEVAGNHAVQLAVRALNVTQNKTLSERDLEVAVLDRTKPRRKFRRIAAVELAQLLGTAR